MKGFCAWFRRVLLGTLLVMLSRQGAYVAESMDSASTSVGQTLTLSQICAALREEGREVYADHALADLGVVVYGNAPPTADLLALALDCYQLQLRQVGEVELVTWTAEGQEQWAQKNYMRWEADDSAVNSLWEWCQSLASATDLTAEGLPFQSKPFIRWDKARFGELSEEQQEFIVSGLIKDAVVALPGVGVTTRGWRAVGLIRDQHAPEVDFRALREKLGERASNAEIRFIPEFHLWVGLYKAVPGKTEELHWQDGFVLTF